MTKRLLLIAPLVACGLAPAQSPDTELRWSADTIAATPQTLSPGTPEGAAGIARAVSIRANSSGIVVADVGDDRIHILDVSGHLTHSFGTRGRGPGELLGVSHLALRDTTILVGDAMNGRVTEFTFGGRFVGTYTAGFAAGAIAANERHILSASRSKGFYASLLTSEGLPTDALRRPERDTGKDNRWTQLPGHDLIVSDSTRTWVFDQVIGSLCSYREALAPPHCLRLPESLLGRLRRYRDDRVARLEKSIGVRVSAAPLAKDLILAGCHLALLLPLPGFPILVVDPNDATLTPVVILGEGDDWVRSARGFAWDGRAFLLIGDDGLGRLNLSDVNASSRQEQ